MNIKISSCQKKTSRKKKGKKRSDDKDRTRTCASEENWFLVNRLNHSATLSMWNIALFNSIFNLLLLKLMSCKTLGVAWRIQWSATSRPKVRVTVRSINSSLPFEHCPLHHQTKQKPLILVAIILIPLPLLSLNHTEFFLAYKRTHFFPKPCLPFAIHSSRERQPIAAAVQAWSSGTRMRGQLSQTASTRTLPLPAGLNLQQVREHRLHWV